MCGRLFQRKSDTKVGTRGPPLSDNFFKIKKNLRLSYLLLCVDNMCGVVVHDMVCTHEGQRTTLCSWFSLLYVGSGH